MKKNYAQQRFFILFKDFDTEKKLVVLHNKLLNPTKEENPILTQLFSDNNFIYNMIIEISKKTFIKQCV